MADYIHVIASTYQPIPRASQNFAIENIQRVKFAEGEAVQTGPRIPIRTEAGNFDRPKQEVYRNVALAIRDLGRFDLLDINLEQAIRNATTPAACRAALDAVTYPVL